MSTSFRFVLFVTIALSIIATGWAQPKEALTFGRAIMGSLGDGTMASTEILLTNRDPNQSTCGVLILFNQSTTSSQPIRINGQLEPSNQLQIDIPRGGIRKLRLTADGALVTGAVLVAPFAPCNEDSIAGTGRFQVEAEGNLNELYSIKPNNADRWLTNGRCVAISSCFRRAANNSGFGNNLGVAATAVFPGFLPPPGTSLDTMVYDAEGQLISAPRSFDFDGSHQAFFPLNSFPGLPDGPLTLIICLSSADSAFKVDLTTIQVGTDNNGGIQFDAPDFADGFESGDTSAWSDQR